MWFPLFCNGSDLFDMLSISENIYLAISKMLKNESDIAKISDENMANVSVQLSGTLRELQVLFLEIVTDNLIISVLKGFFCISNNIAHRMRNCFLQMRHAGLHRRLNRADLLLLLFCYYSWKCITLGMHTRAY